MKNILSTKKVSDITADIIGTNSDKSRFYYIDPDILYASRNKLVLGQVGSGKTSAVATNDAKQAIRRGESVVVTAHDYDIYDKTSNTAKENGYEIKVLDMANIKDTFDLIKWTAIQDAHFLAKTIIEYEDTDTAGYWKNAEEGLLTALILYVSKNHGSFKDIYEITSNKSIEELSELLDADAEDETWQAYCDAIKKSYAPFRNTEARVQIQILTAINFYLANYRDEPVNTILNKENIDLSLPAKKPCIYYIINSGQVSRSGVLTAIFISLMIRKIYSYSETLTAAEFTDQVHVNFILDDFAQIGRIYRFDSVLSTVRSRKISVTIIADILEQLQRLYPYEYQTILELCGTKMILGEMWEINTIEYFERWNVDTSRTENNSLIVIPPFGDAEKLVKYTG